VRIVVRRGPGQGRKRHAGRPSDAGFTSRDDSSASGDPAPGPAYAARAAPGAGSGAAACPPCRYRALRVPPLPSERAALPLAAGEREHHRDSLRHNAWTRLRFPLCDHKPGGRTDSRPGWAAQRASPVQDFAAGEWRARRNRPAVRAASQASPRSGPDTVRRHGEPRPALRIDEGSGRGRRRARRPPERAYARRRGGEHRRAPAKPRPGSPPSRRPGGGDRRTEVPGREPLFVRGLACESRVETRQNPARIGRRVGGDDEGWKGRRVAAWSRRWRLALSSVHLRSPVLTMDERRPEMLIA